MLNIVVDIVIVIHCRTDKETLSLSLSLLFIVELIKKHSQNLHGLKLKLKKQYKKVLNFNFLKFANFAEAVIIIYTTAKNTLHKLSNEKPEQSYVLLLFTCIYVY